MARAIQQVPLSDTTHDEVARQAFVLGLVISNTSLKY